MTIVSPTYIVHNNDDADNDNPPISSSAHPYIPFLFFRFLSWIAFHNFEHATHVAVSANKILNKTIVAADLDPLTHFACVFSAIVHDVDHPGVTNDQLIKENDIRAVLYSNKSVAEQVSRCLATIIQFRL
jgi:hypothetical protein